MPEFGWGSQSSLKDWLFAEGYKFDFYQAVRLLELMHPERMPIGRGPDPRQEAVEFRSNISLSFPASDIHAIEASTDNDSRAKVIVNFLSLAGAEGPLPLPLTELILERTYRRDNALRDFLDIFNHRLISLMYRVGKTHRVALTSRSPEQSPITEYLYAFLGLGLPSLRNRLRIRDRALVFYSGLIWQQPRSAMGLERILTDHFQVQFSVKPLLGKWRGIEPDQRTYLGAASSHAALGQGAALGSRYWDQGGAFGVEAGPLTYSQFLDFLPKGSAYEPLCEWVRFYVGTDHDFKFSLNLLPAEVPESRLGRAQVGWTSWLKTRRSEPQGAQVTLRPDRLSEKTHP